MKYATKLILGTVLAASLTFAAQAPAPSTTNAPVAKKHVKRHKKAKKAEGTANAVAPAKK